MGIIRIKMGKIVLNIKDCRGLSSIKGLMFDNLESYDGALIYASSIWMPFVKHKLNLFFLDENMKVLSQEIAVPISFNLSTWKIYKNGNAKYCLELKNTKIKISKNITIKILNS